MRHRAGRHDWHAGVQRIPNADAPSCRQKRQARRRATSYECLSAPYCRQKKQTRWHVSWPLRSKSMRAVSSGAVRITACVLFHPMATTRAEKPHAGSLPSLPRRHIRHLRGISWVSVLPGSIRPGSLPLSVAFQRESNQAGNGNTHQKASSTQGAAIHLVSASPAATHCGRVRFSRW